MANLPQRARAAMELSQRGFAKLIGVTQPQVSRWERYPRSITSAAKTLLTLIEADPAAIKSLLIRSQGGIAPAGFAGDGGPPPNQPISHSQAEEDAVPDYSPEFGYMGGQEDPGHVTEGDEAEPEFEVPSFSPSVGDHEDDFDPAAQVPDYSPESP